MNINKLYKQESKNTALEKLIADCFKYKIFCRKPTKKHIKWFKETFENDYPNDTSELTKELQKNLKIVVKYRKEKEKFEEKKAKERAKDGFAESDCWNINYWFLEIMPKMLTKMKDNLHGYPCNTITGVEEDSKFIEWKAKLEEMIFLLNEMNEDTCSVKNEYEEEYNKTLDDFYSKYGFFGEKLKSEIKEEERKMLTPKDFPDLYPNFPELSNNFTKSNLYISMYRDKCREKFFNMFSENFWDLWD